MSCLHVKCSVATCGQWGSTDLGRKKFSKNILNQIHYFFQISYIPVTFHARMVISAHVPDRLRSVWWLPHHNSLKQLSFHCKVDLLGTAFLIQTQHPEE